MNILLTGENGYVASSILKYIKTECNDYIVLQKSLRDNSLDKLTLTKIEVVVHAAALVHKKETTKSREEYFEINTQLTYKLALKAKEEGVKQFIFLSTMAVYGNVQGAITKHTKTQPTTFYGESKLAAEDRLLKLQSDHFKIVIVRPPMIYGPKCPGNYAILSKLSCKFPIFPKVENKRSMLFIDNLSELIFQLIQNQDSGIFHPQDPQFIETSAMVKKIAIANNKSIILSKLTGKILEGIIRSTSLYQKVFGDLYYVKELSSYRDNSYQKYNLEQSIVMTERAK